MINRSTQRWWHDRQWTIGICLAMLIANLGLFRGSPVWASELVALLQYDRAAIASGEVWRFITGNLVHWSPEHFALDVGVFLIVGCLYEPIVRRGYPWLMMAAALVVGGSLFLFQPDLATYRGLSGVDSGQFAAALGIESLIAWREKRRWLWVGPAAAIFLAKIVFECGTGQMFFGTEALGDIGLPVPLAHVAGIASVSVLVAICLLTKSIERKSESHESLHGDVALWRW